MKWYVGWGVSGIYNKADFVNYKDALDYLERILKEYGEEYKIKISMWSE